MGTIKDLLKETKESIRRSAKIEERLITVKESVGELKNDTKGSVTRIVDKINKIESSVTHLEAKIQTLEDRINTVFQSAVLNALEKLEKEDLKKLVGIDANKELDKSSN